MTPDEKLERFGRMEHAPGTLWDTETVPRGEIKASFFVQTKKTHTESNMYMGGFLPEPLTFTVRSLLIVGIHQHSEAGEVTLQVGNKYWFTCPLWLFSRVNPEPVMLWKGVDIPCLLHFRVLISWDNPTTANELRLRCVLNGHVERSVS